MPFINLLEWRNRRERITTTGIEIVSTFYVEPASAAPLVIGVLLGHVTGNDQEDTRVLPASDHDMPFCYCMEANRVPLDARSIASGPSMGKGLVLNSIEGLTEALQRPAMFDGPRALASNGDYKRPDDLRGMSGAVIEAIYRPLVTAYTQEANPERAFDFVDPQFFPASRTIPGADSLTALGNMGAGMGKKASGEPTMVETWQEFTIRRVMCPRVPWQTIGFLQNRVNGGIWIPRDFTIPGLTENGFPARTLRFDSAMVTERIVPTCLKNLGGAAISTDPVTGSIVMLAQRWWDITYHFSWRTTYAGWIDSNGMAHHGWLPWNCDYIAGGWGFTLTDKAIRLATLGVFGGGTTPAIERWPWGWYELGSWIEDSTPDPLMRTRHRLKYLNDSDDDIKTALPSLVAEDFPFNALFALDSP